MGNSSVRARASFGGRRVCVRSGGRAGDAGSGSLLGGAGLLAVAAAVVAGLFAADVPERITCLVSPVAALGSVGGGDAGGGAEPAAGCSAEEVSASPGADPLDTRTDVAGEVTEPVSTVDRSDSREGSPADAVVVGQDVIQPGQLINVGPKGCTLGFAAVSEEGGTPLFLSAGHCFRGVDDMGPIADVGAGDRQAGITWKTTIEPAHDSASGLLNGAEFTPSTSVSRNGRGPDVPIVGQEVAPVGAEVCQSGQTSRHQCGTVLSIDGQFTSVNMCALPGDSGGPVYTPDGQAQGLLISGVEPASGACDPSGEPGPDDFAYIIPIADVLEEQDAKLALALTPAQQAANDALVAGAE